MENITLEQFIEKHQLRFECRQVGSRADGLMTDCASHYHCKIKYIADSMSLYFS